MDRVSMLDRTDDGCLIGIRLLIGVVAMIIALKRDMQAAVIIVY